MGKNPKEKDLDLGSEFEDFESEFENLNLDDTVVSDSSSDRSPVTKVKQGLTAGFTTAGKDFGPRLKDAVSKDFPETTSLVSEGMSFVSGTRQLSDQFSKDITPAINQLKRAGRTLAPKFKGYLPTSVQNKIERMLSPADTYKPASIEESRSNAISANLDAVFAAQTEQQKNIAEEGRTERFVDRSLLSLRHTETSKLTDSIRIATEFQANFTKTIGISYLKKSLELQYKHLFVAQDTLAVAQDTAKVLTEKLDQIRHNTALPDTQKEYLTETYKSVSKEALAQTLSSKFRGWGLQVLKNLKDQVFDPAANGLNLMGSMADMYADMDEMQQELGIAPSGFSSSVGGMLGGMLAGKAANKAKSFLFGDDEKKGIFSPWAKDLESLSRNAKYRAFSYAQEQADNADPFSLQGKMWSILNPGLSRGAGSIKNDLNEPLKPISFDVATRTSIVEIIPGYLSKILQHVTQLSTGQPSSELTFDYGSRNFVTVSEFKDKIYKKAFASDKTRGALLGGAVGILRGATAHVGNNVHTFDRAVKDINKVLANAITSKYLIYPERLKKFVDDDGEYNEIQDSYITYLFKGVDDKRTVAEVLLKSLYRDEETVNVQAKNAINDYILKMAFNDNYLNILPNYLVGTGQARHLSEAVTSSDSQLAFNQDFIKSRILSGDQAAYTDWVNSVSTRSKTELDDFVNEHQKGNIESKLPESVKAQLNKLSGNAGITDTTSKRIGRFKFRRGTSLNEPLENIPNIGIPIPLQRLKSRTASDQFTDVNLHGSSIVLPVHLVSSDVNFDLPKNVLDSLRNLKDPHQVTPTPVHSTGDDTTLKSFAERQHPVPDLLQQIVGNTAEMNDKLLSVMAKSGAWLGSMIHRGKTWTKDQFAKLTNIGSTIGGGLLSTGQSALSLAGAAAGGLSKIVGNTALMSVLGLASAGHGLYDLTSNGLAALKGSALSKFGALSDLFNDPSVKFKEAKDRFKLSIQNKLGKFKDKFTIMYVDIYRKDEVDLGKPLVSLKQQKEGKVVFNDGTKIKTSYAISKPVVDSETKQTLISQDDIDHGLVDANNRSIQTASLIGTATRLIGQGVGKILGFGKSILGKGKGVLTTLTDPFAMLKNLVTGESGGFLGALLKGGFGLTNMLGGGIGKLWDTVSGGNIGSKLKKHVGDKLDKIYELLVARLGDPNNISPMDPMGTGHRESAYAEYLAGEREDQDKIDNAKRRNREKSDKLTDKGQRNLLGALTGAGSGLFGKLFGKKSEESESGDSFIGNMLEGYIGAKLTPLVGNLLMKIPGVSTLAGLATKLPLIGGLLGKLGGAGAVEGLGAGLADAAATGLTSAATLTAGAAGATEAVGLTTAAAAGGAGLATEIAGAGLAGSGALTAAIVSNPVGWIVGGTILLGGATYAGYKWLNPSTTDLDQVRADLYGINLSKDTGMFSKSMTKLMHNLEEEVSDIVLQKSSQMSDRDLRNWASKFGFDSDKKDEVLYFSTWFRQRFCPVFIIYLDLLNKAKYKYSNADEMPDNIKAVVIKELQKQAGPNVAQYEKMTPDDNGFNLFTKAYIDAKDDRANGNLPSDEERASAEEDRSNNKSITGASREYKMDQDANVASRRMSDVGGRYDAYSNTGAPDRSSDTGKSYEQRPWYQRWFGLNGGSDISTSSEPETQNIKNQQINYREPLPDRNELGSLSAKFESGPIGSMAIGQDSTGGTSYGKYQIASGTGTFKQFLSFAASQGSVGTEVADRLSKAGDPRGGKNGPVALEWKKLVSENKIQEIEHKFIKASHYDIAFKGVTKEFQDMIQKSKTLQDVLWSTAVQHGGGGAAAIFNDVWKRTQNKTPEELIRAIYEERGHHFGRSTPNERSSVLNRFQKESSIAMNALSAEKANPENKDQDALVKSDTNQDTSVGGSTDVTTVASTPTGGSPLPTSLGGSAPSGGPNITTGAGESGAVGAPSTINKSVGITPVSFGGDNAQSSLGGTSPTVTTTNDELIQLQQINAGIQMTNKLLQAMAVGSGMPGQLGTDAAITKQSDISNISSEIAESPTIPDLSGKTPPNTIPRFPSQVSVQRQAKI